MELRTSAQTSTRAAPTPARVLIGSPEKRRPIPRALSGCGVETPQTARALASQDGPGGPGGQRPPLAVPRPFTPSLRAGRLYVPPSPSSSRPLPVASTGSQAAGAAQAVTQDSDGRSRKRYGEQMVLKKLFLFLKNKFIYFWLRWVFVAVRGLCLVAESRDYSSMRCAGFSLRWLLLLRTMGSRSAGFSSCGSRALQCRLSSCGAQA